MKVLRPALMSLVAFTAICGLAYPLALVAVAKIVPAPAPASLIGRVFEGPGEFWGRASATSYDAKTSAGTNLGPSNPALAEAVRMRIAALRSADPANARPVPIDLVTSSASGLDPDISPAAAYYQVDRVARAHGMTAAAVKAIVDANIQERTLGILGERRVNVVGVNEALRAAAPR